MEIDRTCDEKRARQHPPHSPSVDTRREAETMAWNCGRGAQDPPSHLEDRNRQEWGTLVAALHASRHNIRTVGDI